MDQVSVMYGRWMHIREFHIASPLKLSSESFLAPLIHAAFVVVLNPDPPNRQNEKVQYITKSKTAIA